MGRSNRVSAPGGSQHSGAAIYDHQRFLNVEGHPAHAVTHGSLRDVMACFPVGCLHSLACRVPVRAKLLEDQGLRDTASGISGELAVAGSAAVTFDLCVYVGQNIYAAVSDLTASVELLSDSEELKAELVRVCGHRVDESGNIAPWRRLQGGQWAASEAAAKDTLEAVARSFPRSAPDVPESASGHGRFAAVAESLAAAASAAVAWEVVEVPGADFSELEPRFFTLPPRPGGNAGGRGPAADSSPRHAAVTSHDAGMDSSRLGSEDSGRDAGPADLGMPLPPLRLATGPFGVLRTPSVPLDVGGTGGGTAGFPSETIKLGWASNHYIQPAGWRPDELTVFSRGRHGDNLFHVALAAHAGGEGAESHAILRYLVDTFGPRLVNAPHQTLVASTGRPGLYEGQSPLHMAILERDAKLVQFLVERGADVRGRCTGTFFRADGKSYYGEYPTAFAVCTGQRELVRYLLDHGATVNEDRDTLGNHLIHMAVISDRIAIYDLLVDLDADVDVLNVAGETALQLATRLNHKELFYHMLYSSRETLWTFGTRVSYLLNMRDVDGISRFSSAVSLRPSALETIVELDYLDMLNSLPVVKLLHAKWARGARGHYFATLGLHLMSLVVFTLLCQHWRRGLAVVFFETPEPVLKYNLQDLTMCDQDYHVYIDNSSSNSSSPTNVTVLNGMGPYNCDHNTTYYNGTNFDLETTVLEALTFALAMLYALVELWDIFAFVVLIVSRAALMEMHKDSAPPPPLLHPIPGASISIEAAAAGRSSTRQAGDSMRGMEGATPRGTAASRGAFSMSMSRRSSTIFSAPPSSPQLPFWVIKARALTYKAIRSLGEVYIMRQPTVLLIWAYIICVIIHFTYWVTNNFAYGSHNLELAFGAVFGWLYLLHYARGFRFVGHLVVIIFRIISSDIIKWGAIFLVIVTGFGVAMYLLVREEYVSPLTTLVTNDFSSMGYSILRMFRHAIGEGAFEAVDRNYSQAGDFTSVSICMLMVFTVIATLVMTNLLIAMMNDTFHTVSQDALRHWHMQWAEVIIVMERRFSRRSIGALLCGCFAPRRVADVADPRAAASAATSPGANDAQYYLINIEESLVLDTDGALASAADASEQLVRDRLRRSVRWASGLQSVKAPTLAEIDALMDKHAEAANDTGETGGGKAGGLRPQGSEPVSPLSVKGHRRAQKGAKRRGTSMRSSSSSKPDAPLEGQRCSTCAQVHVTGLWGSTCALFMHDVSTLSVRPRAAAVPTGGLTIPAIAQRMTEAASFKRAASRSRGDAVGAAAAAVAVAAMAGGSHGRSGASSRRQSAAALPESE